MTCYHGAILTSIPKVLPELHTGAHVVLLTEDERDAVELRRRGLEFRDTVLILGPQGTRYGLLFRVPLHDTVVEQVLSTGTGAINIDACRVPTGESLNGGAYAKEGADRDTYEVWRYKRLGGAGEFQQPNGRWPANLILMHAAGCKVSDPRKVRGDHDTTGVWGKSGSDHTYGGGWVRDARWRRNGYTDEDGTETVAHWDCVDGCPVAALNEQSGVKKSGVAVQRHGGGQRIHGGLEYMRLYPTIYRDDVGYGDTGGASRFFHQFQTDAELLAWFRLLITPPEGVLHEA